MKTTVKNDTISVESEVTTTSTMADMLSADYGVDLVIDPEGHLVLKQKINEEEDIETQIKVAQETMRDMEGSMLSKEAEEERKKVDAENMSALQEAAEKLVKQVKDGRYGPMHIAILMANPSRCAYNANIPPAAAISLAFLNAEVENAEVEK